MVTGLARTVLKCTLPGIPDIYQGTELWDLSLVDPDNRRPVDYASRAAALEDGADLPALLRSWPDGRIKQQVIARLLADRAAAPQLYAEGGYEPLAAQGERSRNVIAFRRSRVGEDLIVAVPRLMPCARRKPAPRRRILGRHGAESASRSAPRDPDRLRAPVRRGRAAAEGTVFGLAHCRLEDDRMRPAKPSAAAAVGRVSNLASGPRIYNLFPLLVGTISAWRAELPRIAAMNFDWVYVNPFHETGGSGSLYAIRDPFRLDPRFRDADAGDDDGQIRAFAEDAASHGLKVMADLVINHTANDARLVAERPDVYDRDENGGIRAPFAVDPDDPSIVTVWGDLAELSYREPSAKEFLLGYWDGYVARLQALGIRGFRCDAAYKVPPDVWRHLIGRAKARDRGALFAAETLGCTFDETAATAGAGFDYLFNSFAWWDLRAPWALETYEALRVVAPSIAFPENHDMPRIARNAGDDPAQVAAHLKARYALAAFFSSGVLMPIGYEWGYRRELHVVETSPEQREETGVDISDFVAAVNATRAELPAANVEGAQWRLSAPDAPYLALLRFDAGHPAAARSAVLTLANLTQAPVEIAPAPLLSRTGGYLGPFLERTPGVPAARLRLDKPLALAPNTVRVFAAERAAAMKPKTRPKEPSGDNRVVIETVWPQIDGGRSPVKRIVGETVEVWADIFTDGHEKIAAEVLYRPGDRDSNGAGPRWRSSTTIAGAAASRSSATRVTSSRSRRGATTGRPGSASLRRSAAPASTCASRPSRAFASPRRPARTADEEDAAALRSLMARLTGAREGSEAQLELLLAPDNAALIGRNAERRNLSRYDRVLEVVADRLAARFSRLVRDVPALAIRRSEAATAPSTT